MGTCTGIREAESAGLDGGGELRPDLLQILGVGGVADGFTTHDVAADGAVAGEEAGVDRDRTFEAVEEVAEGLPVPVGALLECRQRHAFHLGHHLAEVVVVARTQRRKREAAVAADDRGDAVDARRAGRGVPQQLGVIVGVRVDEAGCDQLAAGIGFDRAGLGDVANGRDSAVLDRHIGLHGGSSRAVDDLSTSDHFVVHLWFPIHSTTKSDASSDCSLGARTSIRETARSRGTHTCRRPIDC